MRSVYLLAAPASLLAVAMFWACGSSQQGSGFNGNNGPDAGDDGAGDDGSSDDGGDDGCGILGCNGDTAPPCVNLQCKVQDCAPQGKPQTTLTGTVYDPAGLHPLYNVYVYVPNSTPDPITPGDPTCTQCEAPASGSPLIGALTDSAGKFTITKGPQDQWGVPGGDNIPLVMQSGKWRRQVKIPHVDDCTSTDLDKTLGKDKLRLPKNGKEGDMPLIAITTGCDQAECWLRRVGIEDGEFGGPGTGKWNPSQPTHVHIYTGTGGSTAPSGANTQADTYQWWTDSTKLLHYDVVFNSCECGEIDRGQTAYPAMQKYLDNGGRLFATHYYYNWFALSQTNTAYPPSTDWQTVAQWSPGGAPFVALTGPWYSDSSFPKGQAYTDWLLANVTGTSKVQNGNKYVAQVPLTDLRNDVIQSGPPGHPKSTRWLFAGTSPSDTGYATSYVSFNTPVSQPTNKQCGRAVFSDVHLSGSEGGPVFPNECSSVDQAHLVNEDALEFLFFDLSSCVQDDSKPPPPPNPQ